jgi:ABC-type branched-subunit amino acid transport system ATPase component
MALLRATNVTKRFGGLTAVTKMNFQIEKGEILSIIGPNGAGKTTFFNIITGIYRPEEGQIVFNGHNLIGLRPDQIAKLGISRTFQNIRLFGNLTVIEKHSCWNAYSSEAKSFSDFVAYKSFPRGRTRSRKTSSGINGVCRSEERR